MSEKPLILDFSKNELAEQMKAWGQAGYRADQLWQGLYGQFLKDPDEFLSLPRGLRDKLADRYHFNPLLPTLVLDSQDRETRKTLFQLPDGSPVEAVLMHYDRRRTLCISTQSGCAMGCTFCATGQMGFGRHLSSGEIIAQVLYYARQLAEKGQSVSNIVLMGMGEPFHNYEATLQAIDHLNDPKGLNLGARRFTISTVGLIPAIRRFTAEHRQVNLAISLHAADDGLRSSMLPVNRRYPIDELLSACQEYIQQTGRRITFEWALIEGVNDMPEQARLLGKKLQRLRRNNTLLCHVNAIPLNPTRRFAGKATSPQRAAIFQSELEKMGISCTIRLRRGMDIQAGCGQLAGGEKPRNPQLRQSLETPDTD